MNQAVAPVSITHELEKAIMACPFDHLGLLVRPGGKGLMIRVWRPDAKAIRITKQPENQPLGEMSAEGQGLFELHMPRRRKGFNYELEIIRHDNSVIKAWDPYQFGEYILRQDNLEPEALYRHLGASPVTHPLNKHSAVNGTLFKVYAPAARSVSVVGDFNQWDGRYHPMASADDGIWRLFIPDVNAGDLYKFEIHDAKGNCLPLKTDPFSRYCEQWPGLASIVHEHKHYQWSDSFWQKNQKQHRSAPMSVYEVHPGSWQRKDDNRLLSYRELAAQLVPYVKEMGFTHVELTPVSEHPLYDSWGYQPVGLFAPTSRFGSPDDFKYFVDQCHQAGIGVILDWVPAHFPSDEHGLAKFDGSALYEYEDPKRGWHPDWQTYIYNYGNLWVQDFLISNALFWLDEFHIDGLRVDAVASMLYLDYSRKHDEWEPNNQGGNEHLEAIGFLRRLNTKVHKYFPDRLMIAEESTSWPGVSQPVTEDAQYNLGFDYKWNMGWMNDSLGYMRHSPEYRKYHHNELSFSMVYAWSENFMLSLSHDEVVHGKGSLLNRMPGDEWQQFANLRAYYGFMYGHPGKKLLFMGSELGSQKEWNLNRPLDWHLLKQGVFHKGLQTLVSDLNHCYSQIPALHEKDHDRTGFDWLVNDDHEQSVFAFARYDNHDSPVIIISNMTPAVWHNYRIGVPQQGEWQELLNTDDEIYGGSGIKNGKKASENISSHGHKHSLSLTLPPLATVILKPEN